MWALQNAPAVPLDSVAYSYVSHTSDLGVESSIPAFQCTRPLKALLPDWMMRHEEDGEVDLDELDQGEAKHETQAKHLVQNGDIQKEVEKRKLFEQKGISL